MSIGIVSQKRYLEEYLDESSENHMRFGISLNRDGVMYRYGDKNKVPLTEVALGYYIGKKAESDIFSLSAPNLADGMLIDIKNAIKIPND